MRKKEMFSLFDDIATLLKYLYMDERHSVLVNTVMNTPFELYMDSDLYAQCVMVENPLRGSSTSNLWLAPDSLMKIIDGLKLQEPIDLHNSCANRWEEIVIFVKEYENRKKV